MAATRVKGPRRRRGARAVVGVVAVLTACQQTGGPDPALEQLKVRPGLALETYAVVPGAGALAGAPDGAVLVATGDGRVVELRDQDADGVADTARVLVAGLEPPLSLAAGPDGSLVIATRDQVLALAPSGRVVPILPPRVLPDREPDKALTLAWGPDGRLYVAVPAACSSCRANGFEESILRMRPDGHEMTVFARGIGWPGGMAWHRATGHLLVTDRSTTRRASDSLKVVGQAASEPLFQASIVTPTPSGPGTRTSVALGFEPGSAPGGVIALEDGRSAPFGGAGALVALAGSGPPGFEIAPRIVLVPLDGAGRPGKAEVVIDGFGTPGRAPRGRPADLLALEDGSVLISDDLAGLVYRLAPAAGAR